MSAKCLKIGDSVITAELSEIDIDQAGNHVVADIAPLEVEISIPLISTKLKLVPNGTKVNFVVSYNFAVRHVKEKLANVSCSVTWKIDAAPAEIIQSPLKPEVHRFYISLFESSYYITMGAYEQKTHETGLTSHLFDVFEEGYAVQALKEQGLNIEDPLADYKLR